jgi:hypothetical protein
LTTNGAGHAGSDKGAPTRGDRRVETAPPEVRDLADACVRFVERAIGVKLDYEPETLSILDHYLREARVASPEQPAARVLVAHAAGAYFGEVVRRRHASWWRITGDDPTAWRIELEAVYLSFSPVQLIVDALFRDEALADAVSTEGLGGAAPHRHDAPQEEIDSVEAPPLAAVATLAAGERLELDEDDAVAVAERLADLPPVTDDEFYAPSMRLEVLDIAVEAVRQRRLAEGDGDAILGPDDYEAPTPEG